MSKYIPTNNKPEGQVKPKLKVKVKFNEEERTLNEYDAFQMISDLNIRQSQMERIIEDMTQALNGITNAMQAATEGADLDKKIQERTAPVIGKLNLPKLKTETSTLDTPKNIYPNSADNVKLES